LDENRKIHSKEVLVNEINNRIINSDKFNRDDLYLGITFWDTEHFAAPH